MQSFKVNMLGELLIQVSWNTAVRKDGRIIINQLIVDKNSLPLLAVELELLQLYISSRPWSQSWQGEEEICADVKSCATILVKLWQYCCFPVCHLRWLESLLQPGFQQKQNQTFI